MHFIPHASHHPDGGLRPRNAFILHGIFASSRNWRGFARRLAESCPEWSFHTVDLRGHGESRNAPLPWTLEAAADDLVRLSEDREIPIDAVIGHSFGGKVALAHAQRYGGPELATWVLDCPLEAQEPGIGSRDDSEVGRLQRLLAEIPLPLERRSELGPLLRERGCSSQVASWMMTNLRRDGDAGYVWNFDLEGVGALLDDYWATDFSELATHGSGGSLHLVRAAESDRWSGLPETELEGRDLAGVHRHLLRDAGHWLHVDNPDGLLAIMVPEFGD